MAMDALVSARPRAGSDMGENQRHIPGKIVMGLA